MDSAQLSFSALTATLKAAGEATRLRLLVLIAEAELTVSDLTAIVRQSQPRLSRHLRLLAEAGLVERYREGSWVFFRLGGKAEAAMGVLVAQEFEIVRREIDDQQASARPQQARRLADGAGAVVEEVQHLMDNDDVK